MAKRRTTIGKNPLDSVPPATDRDEPTSPAGPTSRSDVAVDPSGRHVFDAWRAGTEAMLRATVDAQNAALAASLSVVDATTMTNKAAMEQWAGIGRRAQQAALEAFQAAVRAPSGQR